MLWLCLTLLLTCYAAIIITQRNGFLNILNFLQSSIIFPNILFLGSWTAEEVIVSRGLREILSLLLSSFKHLYTNVMGTSHIAKIVNESLWISPHTKTIHIFQQENKLSTSGMELLCIACFKCIVRV